MFLPGGWLRTVDPEPTSLILSDVQEVPDSFQLQRFVDAQQGTFDIALAELAAGKKRSHWRFVFPQLAGLGRSPTALFYGIRSEQEARAYLAHPLLGPRYRECVAAVRAQVDARNSLEAIFGELDALKFRSSVEIFGLK